MCITERRKRLPKNLSTLFRSLYLEQKNINPTCACFTLTYYSVYRIKTPVVVQDSICWEPFQKWKFNFQKCCPTNSLNFRCTTIYTPLVALPHPHTDLNTKKSIFGEMCFDFWCQTFDKLEATILLCKMTSWIYKTHYKYLRTLFIEKL